MDKKYHYNNRVLYKVRKIVIIIFRNILDHEEKDCDKMEMIL